MTESVHGGGAEPMALLAPAELAEVLLDRGGRNVVTVTRRLEPATST